MSHKVFKNASWIIGCKIVQSLISFVIGMITARYLGPSNYGLISYAASIVAFFQPIMKLGFDSTLVQEFIYCPEDAGKTLGTSLVFNVIASLASIVGILSFVMLVNAGERETIVVCFLYSLILLFQACEMTQYWFQSQLMSKYPSIVALVAYILVSIYKIYILVTEKGIRWFVVVHVIEAIIIAGLLLILYKKIGGQKLSFSFALGRKMLRRSKYYIWSGLMVVIFQQTDRVMLKLMLGEAETGYYSAALTCVGITAFVFGAIIDSARPPILESRKTSEITYEKHLILLFSMITYLSVVQAIGMVLFAKPMVTLLYGTAYAPAAYILQISVWHVMFGYYGMARNVWILAEEKQEFLMGINLIGAAVNVVGNLLLIPVWGGCGAALASVVTQFCANFLLCYLIKPLRPVGKIILRSFDPRYMLRYVKKKTRKGREL